MLRATSRLLFLSCFSAFLLACQPLTPTITSSPPATPLGKERGLPGGEILVVAVEGRYAYVGVGEQLVVLDVSNPSVPHMVGHTAPLWETPRSIRVVNGFAYVTEFDGLHIINLSDPVNPRPVSFYATPSATWGMDVAGNYAYLSVGYSVHVVDVTDPTAPEEAGSIEWEPHAPGFAYDVAVSGSHLYVADSDAGLRILDVTDPTRPSEVALFQTPYSVLSVAVQGDYAYLAAGVSGLYVIDVSQPAEPTKAAVHSTSADQSTQYSGPGLLQQVEVAGSYAVLGLTEIGLQILNITNPAQPTVIGVYETSEMMAPLTSGLVVNEAIAYVATGDALRLLDISTPQRVTQIAHYLPAPPSAAERAEQEEVRATRQAISTLLAPHPTPLRTRQPLSWPVRHPTAREVEEAQQCDIEQLALETYSTSESLPSSPSVQTACEWAVLAHAYHLRRENRAEASVAAEEAFYQAVASNPAYALTHGLFLHYYGTPQLVEPPPLTEQPIVKVILRYTWRSPQREVTYDITISEADHSPAAQGMVNGKPYEGSPPLEAVQALGSALSDLLPIERPIALGACSDNTMNWEIELAYQDGATVMLTTHGSTILADGGPWQTEVDGRYYLQYSTAFAGAATELARTMGLPRGTPVLPCLGAVSPLEMAFPQ